jgi:uncharacterized protein (DUF2235 family)
MAGRNLILCLDGTSNKFSQTNTNVVKLYAMLDREDPNQLMYYQPGIGTMSPPGVWGKTKQWFVTRLDLAIAWLLEEHTCDAYRFLMRTYEPPYDKIFIFGFSRGAYTARVLAGMLNKVGLLSRGNEELIPFAWDMYRDHSTLVKDPRQSQCESDKFRDTFSRPVEVEFLGLWDSVSSVGWVPFGSKFFDFTKSNRSVRHIRHAVALDERRAYFVQNLWDPALKQGQTLEEVWFPGVHCDVGGGYPEAESGLSKITLRWMMRHAEANGLRFNTAEVQKTLPAVDMPEAAAPSVVAPNHESLHDLWWVAEYLPKRTKVQVVPGQFKTQWFLGRRGRHRQVPDNAKIHVSVLQREQLVPTYKPLNLHDPNQPVDEGDPAPVALFVPADSSCFDTNFDIKPGVKYCFRATGRWIDKNPPAVDAGGDPHAGFVRGLFTFFKRVPSAPYMALLGKTNDGKWFVIGNDPSPRTLPSGRLYCCANDVPGFYGNNHGVMQLEIREAVIG